MMHQSGILELDDNFFHSNKIENEFERKLSDLLIRHRNGKEKEKNDKLFLPPKSLLSMYRNTSLHFKKLRRPESSKRLNVLKTSVSQPAKIFDTIDRSLVIEDGAIHQQVESPQRGRLRPKSASLRKHASSMKEFHHQDGQNNNVKHEKKDNVDDWQNENRGNYNTTTTSSVSPSRKIQTKNRPPRPQSAPQGRNKMKSEESSEEEEQPDISQPIKKSSKPKNWKSKVFLRERKQRDELEQKAFSIRVIEEANMIQARCYACIEEANAFAKSLGKSTRYNIYARGAEEEVHWERIRLGGAGIGVGGFPGAGRRIEKMTVEVKTHPDKQGRLISIDAFFREHARLHLEIRRRRSLLPSGQMPVGAASILPATSTSANDPNNSKIIERKQSTSEDVAGSPKSKTKVNHFNSSKTLDALKSPGKPKAIPSTLEATNHLLKDHNYHRVNRKDTEEQLRKILENTVDVTKVLEEQLRELKARGWNCQIFS